MKPASFRIRCTLALVGLAAMSPSGAVAQDAAALGELSELAAWVAAPDRLLSEAEAVRAGEKLAAWGFDVEKLAPDAQANVHIVAIHAAAARGDAAAAIASADKLAALDPQDADGLRTLLHAALVAGDAERAEGAVQSLVRTVSGDERRALSRQRQWLRHVGGRAPEVTIRTDDGAHVPVAKRDGRVLLVHLWTMLSEPDEAELAGLRAVHDQFGSAAQFQMVGVNADSGDRMESAKAFAEEKLPYPQMYEGVSFNAPITHEAFGAGTPPWQVLVDSWGYVRAVGSVSEPGFRCAVRAAVAEARGAHKPVMPKTRTGEQASVPGSQVASGGVAERAPRVERKSNPEAASKMRMARAYLKTGRRTDAKALLNEIIREYPDSREAKEAADLLELIP